MWNRFRLTIVNTFERFQKGVFVDTQLERNKSDRACRVPASTMTIDGPDLPDGTYSSGHGRCKSFREKRVSIFRRQAIGFRIVYNAHKTCTPVTGRSRPPAPSAAGSNRCPVSHNLFYTRKAPHTPLRNTRRIVQPVVYSIMNRGPGMYVYTSYNPERIPIHLHRYVACGGALSARRGSPARSMHTRHYNGNFAKRDLEKYEYRSR